MSRQQLNGVNIFFGQLPIEQTIDYRKFKFLRKMVYSEESCDLNII